MIKSDQFTSTTSPPSYLNPDAIETGSPLVEKENGGVALSNPSLGIKGWTWSCSYTQATGTIALTNETTAVTNVILSGIMNVTTLSFAFDSNMRPAIGYTKEDGSSFLYYYDSVTEDYDTITLPAGSAEPRLTHDDKRPELILANTTDILCFYSRGDKLYYRMQRDRYATEYPIATVTDGTRIKKVGMSSGLNLRIDIKGGAFVSSP